MNRIYGKERAKEHIPSYAMKVVEEYEGKKSRGFQTFAVVILFIFACSWLVILNVSLIVTFLVAPSCAFPSCAPIAFSKSFRL